MKKEARATVKALARLRGCQRQQVFAQSFFMRRPVRPKCPAGCPVRSQPFVVRHSILDDESLNSLRVCQDHAKANRPSVVLHIKRVAREPERLAEVIHDLSVVIEGIRELFWVRPIDRDG